MYHPRWNKWENNSFYWQSFIAGKILLFWGGGLLRAILQRESLASVNPGLWQLKICVPALFSWLLFESSGKDDKFLLHCIYSSCEKSLVTRHLSEIPASVMPLRCLLSQKRRAKLVEQGFLPSASPTSWVGQVGSVLLRDGGWMADQTLAASAGVWQFCWPQITAMQELLPLQFSGWFPLEPGRLTGKKRLVTLPQVYPPMLTDPSHKCISDCLLGLQSLLVLVIAH